MKKICIFAAIVMCFFTVYQIATSYAKYITEANGDLQENIGKWSIKVNNANISTGTLEQEFEIDQLQYNLNSHAKEGKILPGSTGYFDIVIDADTTDVAVVYDVTLDFSQLDISDSINFSRLVKVKNGEEDTSTLHKTGANTYTSIIELNENPEEDRIDTLRIYLEWENDATGANDEADSELGQTYGLKLQIPVKVKVSQYSGETIEEYVEP